MEYTQNKCYSNLIRAVKESCHPDPPLEGLFAPTSVIALFGFNQEVTLLFIQKADTKGYAWANQMAFPGGHCDPRDKSRLDTALRELEEEMNISRNRVEVIGSLGHFQTINNRDIKAFAGIWDQKNKITYDPVEISRVFEIPVRKLINIHLQKGYNKIRPGIYDLTYPYEDVLIWGVTAKIVFHLIQILLTES